MSNASRGRTRAERAKFATAAAQRIHVLDGATFSVAIAFYGDYRDERAELHVGAWVPSSADLLPLLKRVIRELESSSEVKQ